ncbi:MAG: GlsB/YeaQ/YmgE family stress response membrane protein [Rhodothermales bacterium]|nr:GlsB/YeaQ/YmgE family stress response membrane protein [Rhodothermales bacterium]
MDLLSFLLLLLIAALCGAAGQALAGYSHGGCLVSIVLGLVGAYVGVWLAGEFGLPTFLTVNVGEQPFPIIWAVLGAALLALAFGLLRRMSARV